MLFDLAHLDSNRLWLRWVSSAEGKLFADYVNQVTETILEVGPFAADQHRLSLAAVKQTLATPRVRWLTGMEQELVAHETVYGHPIDPEKYQAVLQEAVRQEFEKALVLEALMENEGQSIRQLAARTDLALHTVSTVLVDLEQEGRAELQGYEGQHPKFIRQAA